MCGITGFLDASGQLRGERAAAVLAAMTQSLLHRGPDDGGTWQDEQAGVALGHRRLSILDLSPEGHQPMASAGGRYVMVFNGEIYNFATLREQLAVAGHRFRGRSDTEIMLAAFEEWGVADGLQRFNGMLAFALWDRQERVLHLARDRMGEKPLYYGWAGKCLLFGSELKSMRAHPAFAAAVDRGVLAAYLRYNFVPGPYTIYRGCYQLPPGCLLSIPLAASSDSAEFSPHPEPLQPERLAPVRYWSLREVAERGAAAPFGGSDAEALGELDALLRDAVALRVVADVPVGAFLSGGIDSSLVVALMQAQSSRPVKTFTIGFHDDAYDEAQYAREVARHLGTDHTELYVTPQEAMAVIPQLPALYDEPFADSSQIPTYLVARLARQEVTVSLSGDGGDELFAGYTRYLIGRSLWRRLGWLPIGTRRSLARALTVPSPEAWNRAGAGLLALLPARLRQVNLGDKLHKLAEIMVCQDPQTMYLQLMSHWKEPEAIVLGGHEPLTAYNDRSPWDPRWDLTRHMTYRDAMAYLPDDILTKVDRAAMGVSLESRIPLLDPRLVAFASSLPAAMQVRDGRSKWLLRKLLHRYVPARLVERPKMGFGVPIGSWLRGPLREWAEALLAEERLEREGYFASRPIRQKWQEHLSGRRNWQYYLWVVLMFQAWLESGAARVPPHLAAV